jgi:uncharacterized membrane protein
MNGREALLRERPSSGVLHPMNRASGVQTLAAPVAARPRIDSIDLLRGLVMVLMTLDHTRDFFAAGSFNPRDVDEPALFLTRWITHFCAPIFVFLAGTSAFLYGHRGKSMREVSWFLFTRGLWLVLLEVTLVRFAWTFELVPGFVLLQVIWAIGCSMIVLSALVFLPRAAIAVIGIAMIVGHNLLDGIGADTFGAAAWIWNILHEPAMLHPTADLTVFALYPLVPWIGVMAAGYAFGPVMTLDWRERRTRALAMGGLIVAAFVTVRAANAYGDPAQWALQANAVGTTLSFINAEKYPPSALFLAMTLGPAIVGLVALENMKGNVARALVTIGRVPLLFYVAHILVIHLLAALVSLAMAGDAAWAFGGLPIMAEKPAAHGFSLLGVYATTALVVAVLYPLCRWFANLKQRRSDKWLSYL